jgi:hypothetical protein
MKISVETIKYTHNKTGNTYYLLTTAAIECTNGREDIPYVVYMNEQGLIFVRERDEFYQKFTKA